MQADIHTLYQSSICTVNNFLCRCSDCALSGVEYQDHFGIAYIRKGNFQFKVFRNDLDAHHGLFLINKPGHEYRVGHVHDLPDECTVFLVPAESVQSLRERVGGLSWFFDRPDIKSVLLKATPETEYLHHCIFQQLKRPHVPRLWTELMMADLLTKVLQSHEGPQPLQALTYKQKRHYLPAIETVKAFINERFIDDISLPELATLSYTSPFHFNRLFKQMTSVTPYQYLLRVRLQHAHLQLRHTANPVMDIAFASGFNSLEHFSAAYKKMFRQAPSASRS